ncbi:MAG: cell division protein FtsQ [Verrucomicrobiota bacterium]|nr:cell division protein FtsQ [Verrucomicrobiota bacterium]
MNRIAVFAQPARTWHDISQSVNPRAMSKAGRRRRLIAGMKICGLAVGLAGATWAAVEVAKIIGGDPRKLAAREPAVPIKGVVFTTDGVLDRAWAERTLAVPKNATLMALDLYALRARLLAGGQVSAAVLMRNFPATLTVNIQERSPVARIMAQIGAGAPRPLLVARDGVAYSGIGYDPALLASLPWLDGVKLKRAGSGFAPIAGMEVVADFLATARNQSEHLYRTFVVVSLAHLALDDQIIVRSKEIPEIIFSAHDNFFRQLARLDYVLDMARTQPSQPIRSVNLAEGLQVPVALETPGDRLTRLGSATPNLPLAFPNFNRTPTHRDF